MVEELRKRIGVEFNEEFKIQGYEGMKFYLGRSGLWKYERGGWHKDMYCLGLIIVNPELVVKLPFKPQYGDGYWTIFKERDTYVVGKYAYWQNSAFDYFAYKSGYVFRTKEEAEKALPKFMEEINDYKR